MKFEKQNTLTATTEPTVCVKEHEQLHGRIFGTSPLLINVEK